jgi:hypothetical protein
MPQKFYKAGIPIHTAFGILADGILSARKSDQEAVDNQGFGEFADTMVVYEEIA